MYKLKKASLTIIIALLAISLFSGCSSNIRIGWVGSDSSSRTKGSYASFTGTKNKAIKLKDGQTVEFVSNTNVKNGTLSVQLIGPDGKQVADFETDKEDKKEINVSKSGTFNLKIIGNKTRGSYDISWSIK